MPGRKDPPALSSAVHDNADWRDEGQLDALPGQQARLRGVPPQAALLPQCTGAQDLALNLRRRARPGSRDRQDRCLPDFAPPAQKGRDAVRTPKAHSEARPAPTARPKWGSRRIPPPRPRAKPPETRQAEPGSGADPGTVR